MWGPEARVGSSPVSPPTWAAGEPRWGGSEGDKGSFPSPPRSSGDGGDLTRTT